MARIRTIKPEFFRHHGLYMAEIETDLPLRIAFAGLWTAADREGRFKWRPNELKLDCLPFDDLDFSRVLDALATRGYLVHYASDGEEFGWIPGFRRHQVINNRERDSGLPNPEECQLVTDACPTRAPRDTDLHKGKGKERKGKEGDKARESTRRFVCPSVADVKDYATTQGLKIDAAEFCDYYIAQGWRLSNGQPMKDWQAAARRWARTNARGNGADDNREFK